MNLSNRDKTKIIEYFKDKPILKAFLFGSYASGKASNKSDIDILVELHYNQDIGLKFIQMQLELEDILKKKVDLVSNNSPSKYIQKNKFLTCGNKPTGS